MYRLIIYPEAQEQIAALPDDYAEVLGVLELLWPWSGEPQHGEPQHKDNPTAAVRRWIFGPDGAGQTVYLILKDQREVHVLLVPWLG
ncbi:MAG: hypothetical protein ACRDSR_17390 [Pseudonocardiaceae bacterium]